MNYKDTKPYMSAFLSVDLLTDFAAFGLTDFIDWRYTHSWWFVFSTQLVNCCPPWMGRNYTVNCWVLPLYCTFSLTSSSPPPPSQCTEYTNNVWQIRNLQNCFTIPNKMTSEDDIKGLVSLKFLRPCSVGCILHCRSGNKTSCSTRIYTIQIRVRGNRHTSRPHKAF